MDDRAVIVETVDSEITAEDPADIALYHRMIDELWTVAAEGLQEFAARMAGHEWHPASGSRLRYCAEASPARLYLAGQRPRCFFIPLSDAVLPHHNRRAC